MSKKFRLDRKIGFQNTFYTKFINVTIDSIGPLIILRSIYTFRRKVCSCTPDKDILDFILGEKILSYSCYLTYIGRQGTSSCEIAS